MTTEEISRGIYLSGGIGQHQLTLDRLLRIPRPDSFEKSRILALQNLDKIAQIMNCPAIRPEGIKDFEGGTNTDRFLLIDYEFHDVPIQVKCMSQGFKTFTLPEDHLPKLRDRIQSGQRIPEWHVELQFHPKDGHLTHIARIKTRLLVDILDCKKKEVTSSGTRANKDDPSKKFWVVDWYKIPKDWFDQISFSGT